MELRGYQNGAISELREALKTGSRTPLLQLPTGSGKTVIVSAIVKMALEKKKKVCFFVNRIELVKQASRMFDSVGIDHGIIQADNPRHNLDLPVQIASVQTYHRRNFAWDFDLGLIDEAHEIFKKQIELVKRWDLVPFIGLSATPFTKGLGNIYDRLINNVTLSELIDLGYLVPADVYGPSQPNLEGVSSSSKDFNTKQIAERSKKVELIASIVDTWHKLAFEKQTICFATDIKHSEYIVSEFVKRGVKAVHIDCYTESEERTNYINAFKIGEIQILSSVGVLTTGFDAPNAEACILARPTKSLALHIQMIGRVLRIHPGKERAIILDHAGNYERLGFHTDTLPSELCTMEKGERKKKKEIPLPKPCPKCKFMRPVKVNICPSCGFEAKSQNKIFEEAGELRKLKELKKDNRLWTKEEKQEFFSGLLGYANKKGYKHGWAANKYREKFGVWPNAMEKTAGNITEEVKKFIIHSNIRYHKSKEKMT